MSPSHGPVLVGVEFERPSALESRLTSVSAEAFERGLAHARMESCSLLVVHVYAATDDQGAAKPHTAQSAELGDIQRALDELSARARAAGVDATLQILWGEPVDELAGLIAERSLTRAVLGCTEEVADALRALAPGVTIERGA